MKSREEIRTTSRVSKGSKNGGSTFLSYSVENWRNGYVDPLFIFILRRNQGDSILRKEVFDMENLTFIVESAVS